MYPSLVLRPLLALSLMDRKLPSNPSVKQGDHPGVRQKLESSVEEYVFKEGQNESSQAEFWENMSKRWMKQARHDHLVIASQEFLLRVLSRLSRKCAGSGGSALETSKIPSLLCYV